MASTSNCQRDQHEPIAIVGMGCRWPGGAQSPSQFWDFLCNKVDGWKEFDDPRFSSKGFHHPNSDRPGGFAMKGAFLAKEDARLFDHSFFGMTLLEVESMDPSQRKLLECAYEAIENAGETLESISGKRCGVFAGNFCLDHWTLQSRDWDNPRPYAFVGAGTSILANRISYIFNLQGPSLTIDTACSSSMYALHSAVNAIRAGDCDSAIVAAGNWIADPTVQIALDKLGALSASSRCHTFDARAEGYARGEGWGAIYLKRPSLAVADNSPIRAFIRGSAVNSNGRTGGITRPSALGQETVIRDAYRNAGGLPFKDTSYFECHGTGTYVGDPIEVAAVGKVFGPVRDPGDPLLVGSVKSNVGHGEGASALASIMKVVLALERGSIPPVYDLQTRNPNIDFETANVLPVTEVTPWPKGKIQRASINSFGYGGANAHCIIDHVNNVWPDYVAPGVFKKALLSNGHANGHSNSHTPGSNGTSNDYTTHDDGSNGHENGFVQHRPIAKIKMAATPTASARQLVVLPLSAHNEQSLKLNIQALAEAIDKFPLADVAYTLGNRRSRFAQRTFAVVDKHNVANGLLSVVDKKPVRAPLHTANLGFVFTGQGAQWHAMGAELFEYRIFHNAIQHLDSVLSTLPNAPSWSLNNILSGNCDPSLIQTAEVSQAACTAVQVGLVDLLASWSVRPSGVAGHSSGEIAAAYAAGRITAAEAIVAAYLRGQSVSRNKQTGAMLAVGLGFDDVVKYLDGKQEEVKVAAINSPGSITLSGEKAVIDGISAAMTADSVFNRKLKTGGNAYHSHHMLPIGREYVGLLKDGTEHLRKLGFESINDDSRYQSMLWVSSVAPAKSTSGLCSDNLASYWKANLESPVRFSEAVAGLVQNTDGIPIHALVEIGPHPALKSPLEQILKASGVKSVAYAGSTLKRGEGAQASMLQLAGSLFTLNSGVDLAAVNAVDSHVDKADLEHGVTCVELPPYQYTYGGLNYHESRASKEYRYRSVLRHDLLGSKVPGIAKLRPQWRNILRLKDVPWLGDHRLLPDAVLPGAGYLAMAIEAISRIHNESPSPVPVQGFVLADVSIKKSLVIPEDDYGIEVLTSLELVDAQSPAWVTFSISSVGRESEEWMEHCTGRVKIALEGLDDSSEQSVVAPAAPRALDGRLWYEKFAEIGLGYGPTFQSLSNIRSDPTSNIAVATLDLRSTSGLIKGGESPYALHPASLDGAIQLGLIACHAARGRSEDATTAFVPVQLPWLYLSNKINDLAGDKCTVVAHGERRGIRGAHLDLQLLGPNGEVLLDAESLRCISYSTAAKTAEDRTFSSPFTRVVWKPDIRTLSNRRAREMYPPPRENVKKAPSWGITNKLAHFVVYSMYRMYGMLPEDDTPKPAGDVGHFFAWIQRKGRHDNSELMQEAREYAKKGLLLKKIDELVIQAPDVIEVQAAKLLHDNMADILFERRTGIDVLISEGLLTPLYKEGLLMTGIYPQLHNVLAGVAHANPNIRVLEIGGGTGGATRIAMKAFHGPNGIKAYRDYTFTDISAGFLSGARESMADLRDVNFSVFDIEIDPVEQGYVEKSYDLIIACQVLHATSNMKRTLINCRRLLKPGGQLVLVETTENFILPGTVVGTFTGYWSGIPDGRVDAPFQSLASWDRSLKEAGFNGLGVVLDDFPEPHNTTSVILSTVPLDTVPASEGTIVHILHSAKEAPVLVRQICQELEGRGIATKAVTFNNITELAPESRAVAFFDNEHLLVNASEEELKRFQHLVRHASSLVAITSTGVVEGHNADGAVITGLLRVLQNENPAAQYLSVDIAAEGFNIEKSEDQQHFVRCIVDYESELYGATQSPPLDDLEGNPKDRELSWQDGCFSVSRHVPDPGFHSRYGLDSKKFKPETLPLGSQVAVKATFETPGVINSLCFEPYKELVQPLPAGFIDVAVAAVGLNARDLDTWTGRVDADYLSSEYSGVITAVGKEVGLKVGDHVYGVGKGQFGTVTRVPAAFASKLADSDDLVQMASMPLSYATAIYALDHIAHIRKGQSILVQSGARDVGPALVSLAKSKGAHVFATAETKEEVRFLVENCGLSESRVLSAPPTLAALREAAQLMPKGTFDIVVSTASRGHYLESYLQVLSPTGHLVELEPHAVASTLSHNIKASYSSIDLFAVLESDLELGQDIIQAVNNYYRQGLIAPTPKLTTTDISQLSTVIGGFNHLIGTLVVTFGNPESPVRMVPAEPAVKFDTDASYVITGALGGLGQSLIRWMGERGARHLALLSRRDISTVPEAQKLVSSLASCHINVQSFVCDVSNKEQVNAVIQQISAERPIKGIVHAAVSYLDLTFDKVSASRWNDGLSAKVQGTKNLHAATLTMPLDFFVMTTSALSVYAFATQGAYTAANNFQDAFARYRRKLGLPASTASFSLIKEVTEVGTNDPTVDLFERNKTLTLTESQFLTMFELAFLNNKTDSTNDNPATWSGQDDDPLSAANLHTYLDPAALMAKKRQDTSSSSQATPRWYTDARISPMIRAFLDAQHHESTSSDAALDNEGSTPASIRREFEAAVTGGERASTVEFVEGAITRVVADMLFVDVEGIDPAKSVADLGVDSLIAAELRNWFLQALGTNISMLDLLDPNVSISSRAGTITNKAFEVKA